MSGPFDMESTATTVPANREDDREMRPASIGPLSSVAGGYSARAGSARWAASAALDAARERLTRLLSGPEVYMFRHRLRPGDGYLTHNVLHNRAGFTDPEGSGRLLLRARYLDRVQGQAG